MTGLERVDVATLRMLCERMKGTIRDFATGKRNINAPYAATTVEVAILLLGTVQREADARGLDTGPWGGDVSVFISAFKNRL